MYLRALGLLLTLLLLGATQVSAVDFSLRDANGVQHRSADYRGKWLVINYWAGWCGPCLAEMPELSFFAETHRQDTVVLGFNIEQDQSNADLLRFSRDYAVSYPVLRSPKQLSGFGDITVIPTTLIISPQGLLVDSKVGPVTVDYLERMMRQWSEVNVSAVAP